MRHGVSIFDDDDVDVDVDVWDEDIDGDVPQEQHRHAVVMLREYEHTHRIPAMLRHELYFTRDTTRLHHMLYPLIAFTPRIGGYDAHARASKHTSKQQQEHHDACRHRYEHQLIVRDKLLSALREQTLVKQQHIDVVTQQYKHVQTTRVARQQHVQHITHAFSISIVPDTQEYASITAHLRQALNGLPQAIATKREWHVHVHVHVTCACAMCM